MANSRITAAMKVVHLACIALWAGGAIWFSFVVAPQIFAYLRDRLPREPLPGVQVITTEIGLRLAGNTVGAIFPMYFVGQIIAGVIAVASGFVLAKQGWRLEKVRCGLAIAALAIVSLHAATVYPRSVRVLDAHYAAKEAGDEPRAAELRKNFGMWHGVSQLLNLATICFVVAALVLAGLTMRDPMKT